MAVIQWNGLASRGNVFGTELNSLGSGNRSNAGTAMDNTANLDKYGYLELTTTFAIAPSATAYVNIFMVMSMDGTNYADGSSSVDPGSDALVESVPIKAVTTAQRKIFGPIWLPPGKFKFIVENLTGQSFPASGNALNLYTANEKVA